MMNKKLMNIQQELKAPKGQYNQFGKYKYRSCEDILEAVKPILAKYDCTLTLSDELVEVGGRIYVKATATLKDADGNTETTIAFAREEETKKGMDASQITGTASSYARKYALNGLFCIDDAKDPDTEDDAKDPDTKKEESKAETYRDKVMQYVHENRLDMTAFAEKHKLSKTTTEEEFKAVYESLNK